MTRTRVGLGPRALISGLLAGGALVALTVGAGAAGVAPQHVTNQQVTSYSWQAYRTANVACPISPDVTKIDESLSGTLSGDPRESGTADVHAVGYEDDTNGAGFLNLSVRISGPGTGSTVATENGYVTLSNTSKLFQGNSLNGLLAGTTTPAGGFAASTVVTNITGTITYAAQGLAPVTITNLDGTLGDSVGPDGPLASPQRGADDNPGVFMPAGAC